MVLISVCFFITHLSYSMVIYHKKSSDLVFGNLLFCLQSLFVDISTVTVTELFDLLGFMGRMSVCSSKGFAEFCLLTGSIFHFRGIMGVFLLLFSTSLWIWVVICFDSHSLPYLFRCNPFHVKYFLCKLESTIVTLL